MKRSITALLISLAVYVASYAASSTTMGAESDARMQNLTNPRLPSTGLPPPPDVRLRFTERQSENRPDASLFLVSGGRDRILTSAAEGCDIGAEISPRGSHVLFFEAYDSNGDGSIDSHDQQRLVLFDVSKEVRTLVTTNGIASSGSWSPHGNRFAFSARVDGTSSVYISSCPMGTMQRIAHDIGWGGHLHWSPNGKWIAFYSSDSHGSYLRLHDVALGQTIYKSPDVGNGWMIQWDLKNYVSFPMEGRGQVCVNPWTLLLSEGVPTTPIQNRLVAGWPPVGGLSEVSPLFPPSWSIETVVTNGMK